MSNYVKVGVESTFGTHVTTSAINASAVADDDDRDIRIEENIDNYNGSAGYGGCLKLSGSLEGQIRPNQLALILQACFGATTSPYTLGIPKSLSLDIGEEIINKETQYCGVGISKLSLKFAAKDFCTFSADWFAKNFVDADFSQPTAPTAEDPVIFYNASVKFGDTASTEIKELSLDIDRKLDEDNYVLNDFTLHRLARTGLTDIGGSITFSEVAVDEYTRARTGSTTGKSVDANNTLGNVALNIITTDMSGTQKMAISCPIALYSKGSRKIDKVAEVEKTVEYKVVGSGFAITI